MLYVIGGNLDQARDYIRRKGLAAHEATCVDDPERLQGLTAPEVVLTGTYITRSDVQAFEAALARTGADVRYGL